VDPLVIPFLTYALVTTFTPGPNNISASSVGMRLGYRRMLLYLLGMSAGFLPIMLASGLLLQIVNVKVILYGITIYSSFHLLLSRSTALLIASAVFLAALGFLSVSLWALTGATFSRVLKSPAARLVFNIVMALLLAYSAVEIVLH
jgi:cysteine/O-acetylserine efflux protein